MANYMTFFPVGNGDMTLIQTKTNKYIMIDCNIRNAENDEISSVRTGKKLRNMYKKIL